LWTLSIYPTYGLWGFGGEIRPKKRQKIAFIRVFARFCITFSRLFTFFVGEKFWKLNSTKAEYPFYGYTVTGDKCEGDRWKVDAAAKKEI